MKLIQLTQNKQTIIDDEDYDLVKDKQWIAWRDSTNIKRVYYALANSGRTRMHRVIMDAQPGDIVDHINGDGLDNRRCNLRIVTASESAANRRPWHRHGTGILGVKYRKDINKWCVSITRNNVRTNLGSFLDFFEACCVRKSAEIRNGG